MELPELLFLRVIVVAFYIDSVLTQLRCLIHFTVMEGAVLLSKLHRGEPVLLFEQLGEMVYGAEAEFFGNLPNLQIS